MCIVQFSMQKALLRLFCAPAATQCTKYSTGPYCTKICWATKRYCTYMWLWPAQPPSFLSPVARPSMTNAFIIPNAVQCPNCLTFDTLTWQIISLFNNIYSSAEIACLLKPNTLSFVSSSFGQWLLISKFHYNLNCLLQGWQLIDN